MTTTNIGSTSDMIVNTPSPFLDAGAQTAISSLAMLHLRRDLVIPTIIEDVTSSSTADYAEGTVTNTRFGSFPHSTLLGLPWGSQVLASSVDTGSRGRKIASKKRKHDEITADDDDPNAEQMNSVGSGGRKQKAAVAASSGFCHVLPPTPESWTISLPHRTQVVYTPDYSYVLQKMRIRPGSVVIEAGAGSGSFTHAAARAVHNGTPPDSTGADSINQQKSRGRVYSFEYHEPRTKQLQDELHDHGLASIVDVTHRDVYKDGFMISNLPTMNSNPPIPSPLKSPLATAVFLDLPAPWNAIPHLSRGEVSPLSPDHPVHLCCFLPCIEQAQRAVTALRQHGWVEINMQELQHRRLEVRREKVGLEWEGLRGVNASPKDVSEAIERLKEVKSRSRGGNTFVSRDNDEMMLDTSTKAAIHTESRADRLARIAKEADERKTFKEGKLVHRTEPEMKNHTSYLVFAVLPMEWRDGGL